MNTAEKIYQEVFSLPDFQAQDMSEFDQFGAAYDGKFNRDKCYDRKVLR